jgi:hypothetical protein
MKVLWARLYPVGAPSQPELPGVPCGGAAWAGTGGGGG